jgi:response regulator RpfG family c-di-GMP phosphodiesterase
MSIGWFGRFSLDLAGYPLHFTQARIERDEQSDTPYTLQLISDPFVVDREESHLIGAEIIGQMKGLHELVPLVKYHHERWDGEGYPDGLLGEAIPLGARILALADSLDTMFSDRPYRQTKSYNEALEEVRRCSGSHFDPQVVAAFLDLAKERGEGYFKNSATAVDKFIENGD